ncbi:unnamed protein product [Acanthoscelides obtectus]|uniref:Uncharacterized protein n=1 Tax=Acanthoscelides obtectus TaxID=200917 RepID=A0A9P0NZC3_ACAOB|nr:unnamed protein product [Acanthoscelides obtectus]CAK1632008.1 hypothetical protein AOBTE_LOCUS7302 [Acanthoscelides obtectus]
MTVLPRLALNAQAYNYIWKCQVEKIKFWDGTSFHYRRAIWFCSASARRSEIFLFFCLGHLRWIVEENFIDKFLGHSC